jgi:hypothetical protein
MGGRLWVGGGVGLGVLVGVRAGTRTCPCSDEHLPQGYKKNLL